jgi:hypothetical protein
VAKSWQKRSLTKRAEAPKCVLRRYTSPCGLTFEAPVERDTIELPGACTRCGSAEWTIADRSWGG